MSFNEFMLPVHSQIPAAGLKYSDNIFPAGMKSNMLGEPAEHPQRFLATLNQVAVNRSRSGQKSTSVENSAQVFKGSDADSLVPEKISEAVGGTHDALLEADALEFKEAAPSVHPLSAFGIIQQLFIYRSMVDNGFLPPEQQFDSTSGLNRPFLSHVMGDFISEGPGALFDWLSGTGPLQKHPANISPEATNLCFYEYLAGKSVADPDATVMTDMRTQFFGLWHQLAASLTSNLNGQTESFGAKSGEPLLPWLQMQETTGNLNLNAETGKPGEQKMATSLTAIKLNANFSSDTAIPPPLTKMNLAGSLNQVSENSQLLKGQTAFKTAAEQSAHSNLSAEGVPAKLTEDASVSKVLMTRNEVPLTKPIDSQPMQSEGDPKGNSFLFSQNQMPEQSNRIENAVTHSTAAQHNLTSQAMNQVVQKAVLLLSSGQSEVQIDLKPDFLGHIRMQIVTDNQQVAVRIVTEFPFVKDMLESNLHQLKAELQAQGLDIEELEVSVTHDFHSEEESDASIADGAKLRNSNINTESEEKPSKKQNQSQADRDAHLANSAIDYFA